MKLKQTPRKSSKLKIAIIVAVVLVVIGGGLAAAYMVNKTNEANTAADRAKQVSPEGIDYGPATDEQIDAGVDQKGKDHSDQPTESNQGDSISVSFTALNPPVAGVSSTLTVRAEIGIVSTTGTCTLTLTKGSTVITKQAGLYAGPTTSTCQGFDVAESELSSGSWNAQLKVVSGDREGSVSRTFTVQ